MGSDRRVAAHWSALVECADGPRDILDEETVEDADLRVPSGWASSSSASSASAVGSLSGPGGGFCCPFRLRLVFNAFRPDDQQRSGRVARGRVMTRPVAQDVEQAQQVVGAAGRWALTLSGGVAAALRNVATSRLSASRLAWKASKSRPCKPRLEIVPSAHGTVDTEISPSCSTPRRLPAGWPRRSGLPVRPVRPVPATRLRLASQPVPVGDIGQLGFVEYAEVDIESAQPATEWQGGDHRSFGSNRSS